MLKQSSREHSSWYPLLGGAGVGWSQCSERWSEWHNRRRHKCKGS